MRLTVPMPPNLGNARMHWRTRHRAKVDYWNQLDNIALVGLIPAPPKRPPKQAVIAATFYVHQLQDPDNMMARFKFLGDWLKRSGYILDDGPKHLRWAGMPEQQVDRKNQRVVLTLESAA